MAAQILDGRKLAERIKQRLKQRIAKLVTQGFMSPALHVILVGNDPASRSYVANKQRACAAVGIQSTLHHLSEHAELSDIRQCIERCNQDPAVHGILLQLPLPSSLQAASLLTCIDPQKDVDGLHPYNMGCLALRQPTLRPCTPYGIIQLLAEYQLDLRAKHAVVVGASPIVGRPMALELLLQDATVTLCHKYTRDLAKRVSEADVVIVAVGKQGVVHSDWIKQGAIVIDVGFHRDAQGHISGDLDFASASERAGWITPVPGGVGQMTVATLLQNTLMSYAQCIPSADAIE